MITRFDHAIIGIRDLEGGIERFEALGFTVTPGGVHTGAGTHNALIRFHDGYLELLAPYDPDHPSEVVRAIERGPEGLVSYALQSDDLEDAAIRFREAGIVAEPTAMQRERPDGAVLAWRLLLPTGSLVSKSWPFLIDWSAESQAIMAREPAPKHPNGIDGVAGVAVAVQNLDEAVRVYRDFLGLTPVPVRDVPELNAREVTCTFGTLAIYLLSPTGPGPVQEKVQDAGDGPFAILLHAPDSAATRQFFEARGVALFPLWNGLSGFLLDSDAALGARLGVIQGR